MLRLARGMRVFTALAALLLLLPAACTAQSESPQAEQTTASSTIKERAFSVAGVSGFDPPWIEFATRDRGYALFTSCGPDSCQAVLFSTDDGARTWKGRKHPQPVARNQQMYVTGADDVVLLAEPGAWYVSRDGAVSWQRFAYAEGVLPPGYPMGDGGRFYVDDSGTIRDSTDRAARFAPAPRGATLLSNAPDGSLWLAGQRDGLPVTWIGQSGPDSWQPVAVPQQGRPVLRARVAISADGKDTWLVAEPEPLERSGGTARARGSVLKATGLPLIWLFHHHSWVPVTTAGMYENPTWSYAATPAGGGLLLVSGPDGLTFLRDRVVATAAQPVLGWVGQLRDGTLAGRAAHGNAVYVSSGTGAAREWTKVVLSGA